MRFLSVFFLLSSAAHAEFSVQTYRLENKTRIPFEAKSTVTPNWSINEQGVKTLHLNVTISSREFKEYEKVLSHSKATKTSLKGETLLVEMDSLSERYLLFRDSNRKLVLEVTTAPTGDPVVDDGCRQLDYLFDSTGPRPPFFLGISCGTAASGVPTFSVTYPKEVELESTLFETRGKGEPWHYYELSSVKSETKIGKFTFKYRGRSHIFELRLRPPEVNRIKEDPPRNLFSIGAGYALLKLTSTDLTASDSKPLIVLILPPYRVWKRLGFGANLHLGIPLSAKENSLSYTQFDGFASYEIPLGNLFSFAPKVGYTVFSQTHELTQAGLDVNELSLGATLGFQLGANGLLGISPMLCGFGSKVTKSHYAIDLNFTRKKMGVAGWGVGGRMQNFEAVSELAVERKFTQTVFYVFVAF